MNQFTTKRSHMCAFFVITPFPRKVNWKGIFNQFMRKRSHTNAHSVIPVFHKKEVWKNTLNPFMRVRSHTSVQFVIAAFLKKVDWRGISCLFMKTRSLKRHVESVHKCSICECLSSYVYQQLRTSYQISSQTEKKITKVLNLWLQLI